MATIENTEGRYEVQDVGFGKVYRWRPELLLVKCDCGEMSTLSVSETTCAWCGTDHATLVREGLAISQPECETVRPPCHPAETAKTPGCLASASWS